MQQHKTVFCVNKEGEAPVDSAAASSALAVSPDNIQWTQAMLSYWQRELRLVDWKLTLLVRAYCRAVDDYGWTNWVSSVKEATVAIYLTGNKAEDESTVVHELLHLLLGPLTVTSDSNNYNEQEQMLNFIADSLVKHRRGGQVE